MKMVLGLKNVDLGFKISFLFQFLVLVVSEEMLLNTILVSGKWLQTQYKTCQWKM